MSNINFNIAPSVNSHEQNETRQGFPLNRSQFNLNKFPSGRQDTIMSYRQKSTQREFSNLNTILSRNKNLNFAIGKEKGHLISSNHLKKASSDLEQSVQTI